MSTRRTRLPLLLAASAAVAAGPLALPGAASAQSCQGAPGASAIQQYCEAIPRGDGGRETSGGGSGSGGSGAGAPGVSAATSQALGQAGRDGAAVQRLVGGGSGGTSDKRKRTKDGKSGGSGNASGGSSAGAGGAGGGSTGGDASGPKDPSGSPLNAAKNAASAGPEAGQAVAWSIVGLSVLGALAAVGLRRQRGTLPPVGEQANDAAGE